MPRWDDRLAKLRDQSKTRPVLSTGHPVVTKHPESGKPVLFVNRSFTSHIEGIPRGKVE